jgi:O-succinylbenzoic acid--CoA ligase
LERSQLAELLAPFRVGEPARGPVIEEGDPVRFMSAFAHAVGGEEDIFLANPSWRSRERGDLARMTGAGGPGERGWLMIPSGGSGGQVKFARHDGWTLASAVGGFRGHFGMERINSVGILPLHHVSGLMAWMRSVMTGGTYLPWAWKKAESGKFPASLPADCCISLVPTQLQRLLASEGAVAWLRGFKVILVGGGPSWEGLTEEAARLRLPLSPSYGSTETAAMVAAVRPGQFLAGMRGCGTALPHARIELVDGVVRVSGESVHRGYYPEFGAGGTWISGDLGSFGADGSLRISGRQDDLIVTGGKKVSPSEVEAALRLGGEFEDIAVIGLADPEWGQSVVACHPAGMRTPSAPRVKEALSGLASFKHPKRYLAISPWPRNAQGKIDRAELARLASSVPD